MKVDLLNRTMVDSDLGVVNAARCSFDKESQWQQRCKYITEHGPSISCAECEAVLSATDVKLIKYLAAHQHWTPFAHAQEVFELNLDLIERCRFLNCANLSGFEWQQDIIHHPWKIRGSLYAWLTNIQYLPCDIGSRIGQYLWVKYPVTVTAFTDKLPMFEGSNDEMSQERVTNIEYPVEECLRSFTLRIHCPIFVKRQLETHRRNFVMTDIEDFSQNEVSRRYIDTEPEIYAPKQWRLQATDKKQGSDGVFGEGSEMITLNYRQHTYNAKLYYEGMNRLNVAHEQSRMILPLSTYTTFWWTGSLKSWQSMFTLRLDSHAQSETREVAQMCYDAIAHNISKSATL